MPARPTPGSRPGLPSSRPLRGLLLVCRVAPPRARARGYRSVAPFRGSCWYVASPHPGLAPGATVQSPRSGALSLFRVIPPRARARGYRPIAPFQGLCAVWAGLRGFGRPQGSLRNLPFALFRPEGGWSVATGASPWKTAMLQQSPRRGRLRRCLAPNLSRPAPGLCWYTASSHPGLAPGATVQSPVPGALLVCRVAPPRARARSYRSVASLRGLLPASDASRCIGHPSLCPPRPGHRADTSSSACEVSEQGDEST